MQDKHALYSISFHLHHLPNNKRNKTEFPLRSGEAIWRSSHRFAVKSELQYFLPDNLRIHSIGVGKLQECVTSFPTKFLHLLLNH